jgi:hypothetical protein
VVSKIIQNGLPPLFLVFGRVLFLRIETDSHSYALRLLVKFHTRIPVTKCIFN